MQEVFTAGSKYEIMACEGAFEGERSNGSVYLLGENCTTSVTYNGTYYFVSSENGLYEVPTGIIILLSLFYGTISITAVIGNSLVIWIIVTSRRMHNVTHYFIANLALADIVIGLFSIPFQFQAALLQRWNLPYFMCPFCPFVQMLSVSVSIFTLTAIAVDRHRAVLKPLSARPSKLMAKVVIGVIWFVGALLGLPMALALRVKVIKELDRSGRIHSRPFCENTNLSDRTMMYYRCLLFFLQYVMPLCIISCAYVRMARRLWDTRAPGNAEGTRDANILKNKKKVIKMLVIVVTLFALCWLPLQTYNFLQEIIPEINGYRYINIIWFSFDWLAMSNSCYNPFIYGIYNKKFRREFQIRFPAFRSRQCSSGGNYSDSIDIDRTAQSVLHSRMSLRLSPNDAQEWPRRHSTQWHGDQVNARFGSISGTKRSAGKNYFDLRDEGRRSRSARDRILYADSESSLAHSSRSEEDVPGKEIVVRKPNCRAALYHLYDSEELLFRSDDSGQGSTKQEDVL